MSTSYIAGRYQILRQLSPGGGSGDVYEVLDIHENEVVVLKFIRIAPTGNHWLEAQILRHLSDPHILPIRNADMASSVPYLVTERALHGTLESRLSGTSGRGLPLEDVIEWMRQASYGIQRAHDSRLLHNDIKPANIFLNAQSEALLGDFGGASLIPPGQTTAIAFQASAETAAPEVAALWKILTPAGFPHAAASIASDVYSLGATAFTLLAGTFPHDLSGLTGDARFQAVARTSPRRLRDLAPHVPQSVWTVVDQALDPDPANRFATILDFGNALASRQLPNRRWVKTNVHTGHIGCWEGLPKNGGSVFLLCAGVGSTPSKCEITAVHSASGRRIAVGCRTVPMRSWPEGVRSVIRRLG